MIIEKIGNANFVPITKHQFVYIGNWLHLTSHERYDIFIIIQIRSIKIHKLLCSACT